MYVMGYFFSTKGKIARLPFLALLVISLVISSFLAFFTALLQSKLHDSKIPFLFEAMILLYVSYCIYIKRFNDIGKMHGLLQTHFSIIAVAVLFSLSGIVNLVTVSVFGMNFLLGVFLFGFALLKKGADPIAVTQGGKMYTFTSDMLTKVNASFVPNFETTGMLAYIGGGHELILTSEQYEQRQAVRRLADDLYVFHLHQLE